MNHSNSFLTALNVFADFFFIHLRAGNKFIYPHFLTFYEIRISPLIFFLPSIIMTISNFFLNVLHVFIDFFIRLRAGNKLVYPHIITFTKFEFHPLAFFTLDYYDHF